MAEGRTECRRIAPGWAYPHSPDPLRPRPPQQPGASTSSARTSASRPPAAPARGLPGVVVQLPATLIGFLRQLNNSSQQASRRN